MSNRNLICKFCNKPIILENPQTAADENGQSVHSDCYAQRIVASLGAGGFGSDREIKVFHS